MNELEKIDQQIRALKFKAAKLRENLKPTYLELNDIPLMKFRGDRLKFSTVKKENKIIKSKTQIKMSKIKVTLDPKKDTTKKLIVATSWAGVKILESEVINPNKHSHELQYSRGEELVEVGKYLESLTDEQVKAEIERMDKKAEAAKKK